MAVTILVVAACGGLGAWSTKALMTDEGHEQKSARESAMDVRLTTPEQRSLERGVGAVGTILPAGSVELRPLAQGRVTEVAVASGEEVETGDLIFRLDDRAARATLADAEATLAETRAQFERYQELQDENVAADVRLEETRAAFRRAQAAVSRAEAELEDRRLTAPFGGVLGIVDIDRGEYVDPTTAFSTLDDLSSVQADFALPERYFDMTRGGEIVRVTSPLYPQRIFEGSVSVKAPRIDPASRSFDVRVRLDNPDRLLASGMFVTGELVFDTYRALTLPDDAIISEGDATYVFTVADGRARRTSVEIGQSEDGRTEIADGLERGARVVVTGWDMLSDGAPVTVAGEGFPVETLD
jgi:membrane fusion protein (multidrug efflux system)